MMTDEQKSKVAELKAAIEAGAATREGAPVAVRAAAISLKLSLQRAGVTARVLAAALGVHESTLCRWERETGRAHKPAAADTKGRRRAAPFRMVRVSSPAPPPMTTGSAPSSMVPVSSHGLRVMHAPSGLVVDGLDVEGLATLLRRMA